MYSEIKFAARKKRTEKGIGVSFRAKVEVFSNLYLVFIDVARKRELNLIL